MPATELTTWHRRLAHILPRAGASLSRLENVKLLVVAKEKDQGCSASCDACHAACSTHLPVPLLDRKTAKLLELVHFGMLNNQCAVKVRPSYVGKLVDNHSRMLWTQALHPNGWLTSRLSSVSERTQSLIAALQSGGCAATTEASTQAL